MIFFSFSDQPKAVSAANAANQLTDREPLAKPHEAPVSELAELADQPPLDRASRLAELRRKRCIALGIAADPAPVPLGSGRAVGFLEREVNDWLASMADRRTAEIADAKP